VRDGGRGDHDEAIWVITMPVSAPTSGGSKALVSRSVSPRRRTCNAFAERCPWADERVDECATSSWARACFAADGDSRRSGAAGTFVGPRGVPPTSRALVRSPRNLPTLAGTRVIIRDSWRRVACTLLAVDGDAVLEPRDHRLLTRGLQPTTWANSCRHSTHDNHIGREGYDTALGAPSAGEGDRDPRPE